jgi:hypothetical protein
VSSGATGIVRRLHSLWRACGGRPACLTPLAEIKHFYSNAQYNGYVRPIWVEPLRHHRRRNRDTGSGNRHNLTRSLRHRNICL